MEGFILEGKRLHIVRVDPGEDVVGALGRYIKDSGLTQAWVLSGYGTLAKARLHWVADGRFPPRDVFTDIEGGIEIVAMSGTVVEAEPHIHVALATQAGAFGGHLEPGSTAYVLCEILLLELAGGHLRREQAEIEHAQTGERVRAARLSVE